MGSIQEAIKKSMNLFDNFIVHFKRGRLTGLKTGEYKEQKML